jgi:hypothetical protein
MAHNLRIPKSKALYLVMLFVHLSISLVNCSLAAYHNLILDGAIRITKASTPVFPQALSQYINQGNSSTGPSV